MKPVKLNLGCGIHVVSGYINVDNQFDLVDLKRAEGLYVNAKVEPGGKFVRSDVRTLPFPENYADFILCHHMIEHLPMNDVTAALREWLRVLKPTGTLYIATLDFDSVAKMWQEWADSNTDAWNINRVYMLMQCIYGNQITPGEFHCCPFNERLANFFMSTAGFPYWEVKLYKADEPAPAIEGVRDYSEARVLKTGEVHIIGRKTPPKKKGKAK